MGTESNPDPDRNPGSQCKLQVVAAANDLLEARRVVLGSKYHENVIKRLANLVANRRGALAVLEELQQK